MSGADPVLGYVLAFLMLVAAAMLTVGIIFLLAEPMPSWLERVLPPRWIRVETAERLQDLVEGRR